MKKLSDYKNSEALELWGDIIEPMATIISDSKISSMFQSHEGLLIIAKEILVRHKEEVTQILLRIDPTPIDGINVIARIVNVFLEFLSNDELKGFFGFAESEVMQSESIGSATENTKDGLH